jgi:hypothetical protein
MAINVKKSLGLIKMSNWHSKLKLFSIFKTEYKFNTIYNERTQYDSSDYKIPYVILEIKKNENKKMKEHKTRNINIKF